MSSEVTPSTFWLSRSLMIRGMGLLYLLCGIIVLHQLPLLIGDSGLAPIPKGLPDLWNYPSLLLFFPGDDTITALGLMMVVGSLPLIAGFCNWPLLFVLWVCQLSLVNGGGLFYGFGWETMMLELTFMCLFITHPWRPGLFDPKGMIPTRLNQFLFWWLLFKLMLGAGLIKLRGDQCWWDLTCLIYHYETQPNPHFLSWYLHQLPVLFHQFEVLFNHFVEVLCPVLLLFGRRPRIFAGLAMVLFQVALIFSGNLAYINWQTLVILISVFDDRFFRFKVSPELQNLKIPLWQRNFKWASVLVIAILSLPVLKNMIGPNQAMNQSYSRWHLVNSYGLFGGITKERYEVLFFGTDEVIATPQTQWKEYSFYCKPGPIDQRPCLITPYHLRLDWQLWFSAMRPELQERWLTTLAEMMLRNDVRQSRLGIKNPFAGGPAPRQIKMDLYRYKFTAWDEGSPNWWRREFVKTYFGPVRFQ